MDHDDRQLILDTHDAVGQVLALLEVIQGAVTGPTGLAAASVDHERRIGRLERGAGWVRTMLNGLL